MDINCNKKPKLPRKRKKALKKHDKLTGRNSYRNTIKLFNVTDERYCKFWKKTVTQITTDGSPEIIPISYW